MNRPTSHPWLSPAEHAYLAQERASIEANPRGYTSTEPAYFQALNRLLYTPQAIASAIAADELRAAVRLAPRDPARHAVSCALGMLALYAPGAGLWSPWHGFEHGNVIIGVESPRRPYPGDERYAASDARWCVDRLAEAITWLSATVPLTVVSQCRDPDLVTARGAAAQVRFLRAIPQQVAA
jgi:hypothetical protein